MTDQEVIKELILIVKGLANAVAEINDHIKFLYERVMELESTMDEIKE